MAMACRRCHKCHRTPWVDTITHTITVPITVTKEVAVTLAVTTVGAIILATLTAHHILDTGVRLSLQWDLAVCLHHTLLRLLHSVVQLPRLHYIKRAITTQVNNPDAAAVVLSWRPCTRKFLPRLKTLTMRTALRS